MLKSNLLAILFICFVIIFINSSQAKWYDDDDDDDDRRKIGTITEKPNINLPQGIEIPNGHVFKFLLYASGVQKYKCATNETTNAKFWAVVGPTAYLINDIKNEKFNQKFRVGSHYFQDQPVNGGRPTWESTVKGDKSLVITVLRAQAPSPDDPTKNVPWLVTQATHNEGPGAFSDITYVLRIATYGGVAPSVNDCGTKYKEGQEFSSHYTTEYWYLKASS